MDPMATTDLSTAALALLSVLLAGNAHVRRSFVVRKRLRRCRRGKTAPSIRRERRRFHEVTKYLNNFQFSRTFRVPRFVFRSLLDILRPDLQRNNLQAQRCSGGEIEPSVRLAVTLRLLAGGSYLDLVTNYNIAPATVYSIFHDTLRSLCERIPVPNIDLRDTANLQRLAEEFRTSRSVPNPLFGCIGAVDGICVRVMKPHNEFIPRKFFCRKGMHAIPVQAIVSASYKFLYMSALCAGSTNDCTAFAVSGIARRLRTAGLQEGFWIAGDAAYECRDGILTPWSKHALQCTQHGVSRDAFNYYHSSARVHVEQSFGILVARFGILWRPLRFDLTKVPLIISACMRIHNLCVDLGVCRPPSTASDHEEQDRDEAYRAWWRLSQSIRSESGEFRSRSRDESMLFVRESLTQFLDRQSISRPNSS